MEDNEEQPIHPGVQLILARMNSHPDEFANDIRWANKYQPYKAHWNGTEKRLFANKLREIRMQVMHEAVMKELTK